MKNLLTAFVIITISQFSHVFCMEFFLTEACANRQAIIYAPWRENYINGLQQKKSICKPCTFCNIISNKNNHENLILHRGKHSLIMLASQPYIDNGIHFLIVPYEHERELSHLSPEANYEENIFTQKLCALFSSDANETYINSNQGLAAGASIPDHQHRHIMVNNAPNYYNLVEAAQKTKKSINLPTIYEQALPQINNLESVTLPKKELFTRHKDCYYCSTLHKDTQENFIIHRGTYATVMLSHYPTYFGEIDIIPNEHIESLESMTTETYDEINKFTLEIYPLVLKIINTQDSNIGLISYGNKATRKGHIIQKIVPRKDTWRKTPITRSNHISGNIKKLYNKLLSEWHALLDKNYYKDKAKL